RWAAVAEGCSVPPVSALTGSASGFLTPGFATAGCSVPDVAGAAVLAAGASVEVVVEASGSPEDAAASPAAGEGLTAEVVFGAVGRAVGRVNAMVGVVAASSAGAPCPLLASPVFA